MKKIKELLKQDEEKKIAGLMSLRGREEKEHKETKKKLTEKEDELKSCRAKLGEEIAKKQLEVANLNSRVE